MAFHYIKTNSQKYVGHWFWARLYIVHPLCYYSSVCVGLYEQHIFGILLSPGINQEIISKTYLMIETKPKDTNMPSGIISISQFKMNIASTRGEEEGC